MGPIGIPIPDSPCLGFVEEQEPSALTHKRPGAVVGQSASEGGFIRWRKALDGVSVDLVFLALQEWTTGSIGNGPEKPSCKYLAVENPP